MVSVANEGNMLNLDSHLSSKLPLLPWPYSCRTTDPWNYGIPLRWGIVGESHLHRRKPGVDDPQWRISYVRFISHQPDIDLRSNPLFLNIVKLLESVSQLSGSTSNQKSRVPWSLGPDGTPPFWIQGGARRRHVDLVGVPLYGNLLGSWIMTFPDKPWPFQTLVGTM